MELLIKTELKNPFIRIKIKSIAVFFILSFISIYNSFANETNLFHYLPDFSCSNEFDGKAECFERAKEILLEKFDSSNRLIPQIPVASKYNKTIRDVGFLFIHGLYASYNQFSSLAKSLDQKGFYTQEVLLPGHGELSKYCNEIRYSDWIEEVRRSILLAKIMSKKLVIVGQSTGGLLAIQSMINSDFSDTVSALILIEPAIKVNTLIEYSLNLPDSLAEFNSTVKKALEEKNDSVCSIDGHRNMAQQVVYLRNHTISQIPSFNKTSLETIMLLTKLRLPVIYKMADLYQSYTLGTKINIPTLIFINSTDKIVENEHIKAFYNGLKANSDNNAQLKIITDNEHGQITYSEEGNSFIEQSIFQFLAF